MKTIDPKTLPHQSDPLRNEEPIKAVHGRAPGEAPDDTIQDLPDSHLPAVYRKAAALAGSPLAQTQPDPSLPVPFHPRRETEESHVFAKRFRSGILKRLRKLI